MSCASITALSVWRNGIVLPSSGGNNEPDDPQGTAATDAGAAWLAAAFHLPARSGGRRDLRLLCHNDGPRTPQYSGSNRRRGAVPDTRLRATHAVAAADAHF